MNGYAPFVPILAECATTVVAANTAGHYINITISAYAGCRLSWRLVDATNWVTVASGVAAPNTVRRVGGLYARYQLFVKREKRFSACGGDATISN